MSEINYQKSNIKKLKIKKDNSAYILGIIGTILLIALIIQNLQFNDKFFSISLISETILLICVIISLVSAIVILNVE